MIAETNPRSKLTPAVSSQLKDFGDAAASATLKSEQKQASSFISLFVSAFATDFTGL